MKIIALDTATKTGWASRSETGQFMSGVFEIILKRGESPGMRFLRFRAWLKELITLNGGVDLIVYEQAHHRGGAATQFCVGLTTEILAAAADNNAESMPVHTGALKKWACGHGKASKEQMMDKAKGIGYHPQDDNEADACLLFSYALESLNIKLA
jgi:Holliday junction resolvasome RuvABC endonuclease subunit